MRQLFFAAFLVGSCLLSACGSSSKAAPLAGLLQECSASNPCATGLTCDQNYGVCTKSCTGASDCPGGACATNTDASKTCAPTCTGYVPISQTACVDGVPIACNQDPAGQCATCGCSDSSQRCVSGACVAKLATGQTCVSDSDCTSGNCGEYSKLCRVAVGATCTPKVDCEECATYGTSTWCTRPCADDSICNGNKCIGFAGEANTYDCQPNCSSACPVSCSNYTDPNTSAVLGQYCPLSTWVSSPRPDGSPCSTGSDCTSNDCYLGRCETPCTTASQCATGYSCASVWCSGVACGFCLPNCGGDSEASCSYGTCSLLGGFPTGGASVCSLLLPSGSICGNGDQCSLGHCNGIECL
jgi:hypothetical protein